MHKKPLLWQLYSSYLIVLLFSILAASLYFSNALKSFFLEELVSDLEARAYLLENQFRDRNASSISELCKELGEKSKTRITYILPNGLVLGDSKENPKIMDNHADRPEIIPALNGKPGKSLRYSHTLEKEMVYVAIPVLGKSGDVLGVIRTSLPISSVNETLHSTYWKIFLGGLLIAVFAIGISFYFSSRFNRPIEEMKKGAVRFAKGELKDKLPIPNIEELASLAEAMNEMAAHLDERIDSEVSQRNEKDAILSSMIEGVLAVDLEEKILSINEAATGLLGIKPENAYGRQIQEMVRNSELENFVRKTLSSKIPLEDEIALGGPHERYLQLHGTALRDTQNNQIGALIVLNDVTRIHRLENMRKDFVANVSHELKTPITSIKGFVETLLDGAYKDPKDAKRFLGIISKHTDRLNSIIEDLLSLSRLEEEKEGKISLKESSLKNVLKTAIQVCETKSKTKNIEVALDCPEEVQVRINPPLLEQAIVNLLDNAIKYSENHTKVEVSAYPNDKEISISVKDEGYGIDQLHLPRLFERFYRVDKSRSRDLGGTGLGLAIVKHIVNVHKGSINVESSLNKGSIFTIHLPKS